MIASTFSLGTVLPELVLAVGALAIVLFGALRGEAARGMAEAACLAALVVAGVLLILQTGRTEAFNGAFVADGFARFMKILAIIGSIAAILLSFDWMRAAGIARFEYSLLILLSTLGMMMMISANDLVGLYLGLELQALSMYVLAAINRDDARASEAGLKFFVLGSLSSGMLLYGASLIYGFSATLTYPGIAAAVQGGVGSSTGVVVGLVFVLAGMAFKLSAVPFHMWTPDVYEGAPTPVAAFFAAGPKVAAMAMTVRIVIDAFPTITGQWQQVIVFISIASMLLGSFAAIGQTNIKRLLAYSSIGHMGFALVGLAAGSLAGVQGVAIYMALYLVMTIGAFSVVLAMQRGGRPVETISDLSGLSRTNPGLAYSFAILLFSLAGIPPLAGFFAKYFVFSAAIEAGLYPVAVIGVIASVIATFYYLRIIRVMFFDEPLAAFDTAPALVSGMIAIAALFNLLAFPVLGLLVRAAQTAAASMF